MQDLANIIRSNGQAEKIKS